MTTAPLLEVQPVNEVGDYRFIQYAEDVVTEKILACKWVRLACQRFLDDLDRQDEKDYPFYFDQREAELAVDFFPIVLRHHQGEWADLPVFLEPWEQFIIANIYGWKRKSNGYRRFIKVYIFVARKNGKTLIADGIGLKGLFADGEPGARVVCAATKRKQARLVWDSVVLTLEKNPELMEEVGININKSDNLTKIYIVGTASDFIPLGKDSRTEDGHNIHVGIIDEYHEHPNDKMVSVIRQAMSARRQPLLFIITTAGLDERSPAYEEENYLKGILDGTVQDDTYFGMLYTLDEGDDWRDVSVWIKANPNLGISKKIDSMLAMANEAEYKPETRVHFLTKDLNLWTRALSAWLDGQRWKKNNSGTIDEDSLHGRRCWMALDYSVTQDTTVETLVFPPEEPGERWQYLHRIWVPAANLKDKEKDDRVPYTDYLHRGIISWPGETINREEVDQQIRADLALFNVQEFAYDEWNEAKLIAQDLELDGFPTLAFPQGIKHISPAAKEWQRMVLDEEMEHGSNPMMDAYVAATHIYVDANENIKPMKEKKGDPTRHIDGVITSLMCTWRAKISIGEGPSVYEERGVRAV